MRIDVADLTDPQVIALLDQHLRTAHAASPPGKAFALDVGGLAAPGVTLWAAWDGATLAGVGALRDLGDRHGEIKSMRTADAYLRRGVARALLEHILAEARARGMTRVSLETGGNAAFAPARAMYEAAGFARCAAFGEYVESDFNLCFSRVV